MKVFLPVSISYRSVRRHRGATLPEFAIMVGPFLLLMFVLLYFALVLLVENLLNAAADSALSEARIEPALSQPGTAEYDAALARIRTNARQMATSGILVSADSGGLARLHTTNPNAIEIIVPPPDELQSQPIGVRLNAEIVPFGFSLLSVQGATGEAYGFYQPLIDPPDLGESCPDVTNCNCSFPLQQVPGTTLCACPPNTSGADCSVCNEVELISSCNAQRLRRAQDPGACACEPCPDGTTWTEGGGCLLCSELVCGGDNPSTPFVDDRRIPLGPPCRCACPISGPNSMPPGGCGPRAHWHPVRCECLCGPGTTGQFDLGCPCREGLSRVPGTPRCAEPPCDDPAEVQALLQRCHSGDGNADVGPLRPDLVNCTCGIPCSRVRTCQGGRVYDAFCNCVCPAETHELIDNVCIPKKGEDEEI